MASILKVDKIRGTGLDSDTISLDGSGNITIPKNVTFSGTTTGAGSVDIIANSTSGGSTVSLIEIDLSTSTNYLYQQVVIYGLYGSAASDLYCQLRATGGAYRTGATYGYGWNLIERTTGADANGAGGTTDSYMRLNWYGIGNAATERPVLTMNISLAVESSFYTT